MNLSFISSVYFKIIQMSLRLKNGEDEWKTNKNSRTWEPIQKKYVGCIVSEGPAWKEGRWMQKEQCRSGEILPGYTRGCLKEARVGASY